MTSIQSYGAAFPTLRLSAQAYRDAWGACAAKGLRRKAFCAFDEDPLTLAISAARNALAGGEANAGDVGALFVGATTWPYEEKPAAASLVTALLGTDAIRTAELRGSRQAGLQALLAAAEYVAAHPDRLALAVAVDAPSAAPDAPYEHALAAGAAAFVVGSRPAIATIAGDTAVTMETFGSRFRRHGEAQIHDLELRVDDDAKSLDAVARVQPKQLYTQLATGGSNELAARAARHFGGEPDGLWPDLGDTGAAGACIALAHSLDTATVGDRILALAVGGGATAVTVEVTAQPKHPAGVTEALRGGRDTDYLSYLKHKRVIGAKGAFA
ncbi:hypothetical protein [Xanthobacter autotrophicus]|uniref:hypothetical protein n=1 Tax=Xanthobacter autotrophicus TaxID=280 RepID=UPI003727CD90